ncbi:tRNA (guanine(37)-N1)-methyltransferase Trm5b [Methanocaldococcus lauensis]|nr:tRNA (guanine(37)-N1)-methyltransferase Trm5b [Methanocaldococcus lauensis]
MVLCAKVYAKEGEKTRRLLLENKLLNKNYKIVKEGDFLYIPLNEENLKNINLKDLIPNIEIVEKDIKKKEIKRKPSFREVISKRFRKEIDEGLIALSYDVIGDLVILQISDKIDEKTRKEIGEIAYKLIPCKGVFRRKSEVKGDFRVRELEHLAGENRTLTLHKENGYRLWVDIAKVYFSPRLGGERARIMKKVSLDDVVVDMFAGVGPFSIACRNAKKIYAIDINPHAIELLKKNIKLNKLEHKIIPILSDVREVDVKGNRVIMNLPKYSHKFIDKALEIVNEGGVIHYYTIGSDFNEAIKLFEKKCDCKVLEKRIVKSYAPREYVLALDFKILKK